MGNYHLMACGGELSVDKDRRVEGSSWWPMEITTDADVDYCIDRANAVGEPIKVLLTHGGPAQVSLYDLLGQRPGFSLSASMEREAEAQRERLGELLSAIRPELNLHGHYHAWHNDMVYWGNGDKTQVVGLEADFQPIARAMCVLDEEGDLRIWA